MGKPHNWRARGDHLAGFGRDCADDAVGVGAQRCVINGVARKRRGAIRPNDSRSRLIGGKTGLVELGVGGPALFGERGQPALFGFGLG